MRLRRRWRHPDEEEWGGTSEILRAVWSGHFSHVEDPLQGE